MAISHGSLVAVSSEQGAGRPLGVLFPMPFAVLTAVLVSRLYLLYLREALNESAPIPGQ
jgi:hypothetical protein